MDPYRQAPPAAMTCPRCAAALGPRALGDATLHACRGCHGIFVEARLLPRVTDALDLGGEVLAEPPRRGRGEPTGGPMYLKCPCCAALMRRKLFAQGAKVVVDECAPHGTWFDDTELRTVAEFAAGGGLERAAREAAAARAQPLPLTSAVAEQATADQLVAELDDESWLLELVASWFTRS